MAKEQTLRLRDNHGWKARPGYAIIVLDRGAVRLDYPEGWVVTDDPDSIKIHDRQPPNDDCVLAVSYLRLPPLDWSGLSVGQLVESATEDDERKVLERKPVVEEPSRGDLQIAWQEIRHLDEGENREAVSRVAISRAGDVQCLLTLDFWADQSDRFSPVWDEVLRSLVLGWYVDDPTKGPLLQ